jgi:hypothetical protein
MDQFIIAFNIHVLWWQDIPPTHPPTVIANDDVLSAATTEDYSNMPELTDDDNLVLCFV